MIRGANGSLCFIVVLCLYFVCMCKHRLRRHVWYWFQVYGARQTSRQTPGQTQLASQKEGTEWVDGKPCGRGIKRETTSRTCSYLFVQYTVCFSSYLL